MCCGLGAICGSCLGSCCVGCCCSGLNDCKAKHGPASRVPYIFLMFLSCIFAVVMSLYGQKELYNNNLLNIDFQACNQNSCQGNGTVYRTSFALFLFFIIHWIVIRWVPSFHWLFLTIKLICFISFLTISFWIPGSFYTGYSEFARVASIFFLILQLIVLITWAWDVNQRLIDKIGTLEKENEPTTEVKGIICLSKSILIGVTFGLNAAVIALWVLFFQWFVPNDNCNFNEFVVSFTIALVIIITALSYFFPHASIFTAAVVSFYITYLCYAALSAYPQHNCNTFANENNTATTENSGVLWIGLVITAIAISYAGFSVSSNAGDLTGTEKDDAMELEEGNNTKTNTKKNNNNDNNNNDNDNNDNDNADAVADTVTKNNTEKEKEGQEKKKKERTLSIADEKLELDKRDNLRFHLCMAFAAIYMSMLYTNWGTNTISESTAQARGKLSVWINLSAQWLAVILYLWTLIAPKMCPERFGIEQEE